ncbi:MAG: hypothetical protein V2G33_04665 [bacterium JZ-2024 1]
MSLFPTHEIGSLAKPGWRVKALTGKPLTNDDWEHLRKWAKILEISPEPLEALLRKEKREPEENQQIVEWSSLFALRLLEKAGLDYVFDGEQHRTEMYEYPIRHIEGMVFLGSVRSFDNKYYKKAACVGPIRLVRPYHTEEFLTIRSKATKPVKVPVTGAYTLADWSFDEYYAKEALPWDTESIAAGRKNFVHALAEKVIRPNLVSLMEAGAEWIQIDEPAATTHPDEVPLFQQAFLISTRGLPARFSIHICFSDYNVLFPHILEFSQNSFYSLALEFANRDSTELGTVEHKRPGYDILKKFANSPLPFKIGMGVVDVHTNFVESVELIRDRILYGAKILGDPEKILVTPDCGLRTRTWEIAYEKLCRMTEAAHLAAHLV